MTIYAAGALLWRIEKGNLMVAMIHRGRYNDYSWPKGKVDPGETLPQAAVREISEETGFKIKLGPQLHVSKYQVPSGVDKEVYYWAAKVGDKALVNHKFEPNEEVASIQWVMASEVAPLLTYPHDIDPLNRLVALHESGHLDTKPFIVLRHATATPRDSWKGEDGKRTLTAFGALQAKALVPTLSAYRPSVLISSPWVRCYNTLAPYAKKRNRAITERSQLSELGNKKGPQRTKNVVDDLVATNKAVVLCSHRPALPTILDVLAKLTSGADAEVISSAFDLKPAEILVIHLTIVPKKQKRITRQIVSVERHALALRDPA